MWSTVASKGMDVLGKLPGLGTKFRNAKHGNKENREVRAHELAVTAMKYRQSMMSKWLYVVFLAPVGLVWIMVFISPLLNMWGNILDPHILSTYEVVRLLVKDYLLLWDKLGGAMIGTIVLQVIGVTGVTWAERGKMADLVRGEIKIQEQKTKQIEIAAEKAVPIDDEVELVCTRKLKRVQSFTNQLAPAAIKIEKKYGIKARAILAQIAQESGWDGEATYVKEKGAGRKVHSHNYFNIKATDKWISNGGNWGTVRGWEDHDGDGEKDKGEMEDGLRFRIYENPMDSFIDYAEMIKSSNNYKRAWEKREDEEEYLKELQAGGYATDGKYAENCIKILNKNWSYMD